MLNYILSDKSVTVFLDNKVITTRNDNSRKWERLLDAIKAMDLDTIRKIVDPVSQIKDFSAGHFEIKSGNAYYQGELVDNSLTKRMVVMMQEGFDIQPMVEFINNLMQNPSNRAVNELYSFLEACDLPITPDGCFIAYKRIREDYTDCHSGTVDNHVGCRPSMPRNRVDDNKDRTCSHGLHVCSIGYLNHFTGTRLVVCKVNPKDVVSIPTDYNNSKMRVCEYEVIQEIDLSTVESFQKALPAVYEYEEQNEDEDEYEESYAD